MRSKGIFGAIYVLIIYLRPQMGSKGIFGVLNLPADNCMTAELDGILLSFRNHMIKWLKTMAPTAQQNSSND